VIFSIQEAITELREVISLIRDWELIEKVEVLTKREAKISRKTQEKVIEEFKIKIYAIDVEGNRERVIVSYDCGIVTVFALGGEKKRARK